MTIPLPNYRPTDGQQVETLYRIMCAEFGKLLSAQEMNHQVTEIMTVATNMVTDYNVRVLEVAAGLAPSTEVQTAVAYATPSTGDADYKGEGTCTHCAHHVNRRSDGHWTHSATLIRSCAVHKSRLADMTAPKITKDMLERPTYPEPVAKAHADRLAAYRRRRLGETPPGYTHTDAYAFSRARKAELEAEKGRLITVRELTNQDLGKYIVVTLTDGHQIAGTLTYIEYLSELVHRLRLHDATWSKVPGDKGLRTLKVNTDRPVRVTDR